MAPRADSRETSVAAVTRLSFQLARPSRQCSHEVQRAALEDQRRAEEARRLWQQELQELHASVRSGWAARRGSGAEC